MKFTTTLNQNYEFRRLYAKGKTVSSPYLAIYCRKRRGEGNRLGFTVGKKVGGAVTRNRVRRRLRAIYRLSEDKLRPGYEIVVVARTKAAFASYRQLDESFRRLADKLGLLQGPPKC